LAELCLKDQVENLLANGEAAPSNVIDVQKFMNTSGNWFLLSRNRKATGCKEAAALRNCLGQQGIPLERELKSYMGFFVDEAGHSNKVLIHCRGDKKLDFVKIRSVLGIDTELSRVDPEGSDSDDNYGLINPFQAELSSNEAKFALQIFDKDLLVHTGLPRTMMTNAGDRTWGIEFRVEELIESIPRRRAIVDDVTVHLVRKKVPAVGIVTGNGPESGALLWKIFNDRVRERRSPFTGDVYLPKTLIRSVPAMGLTMELHSRGEQVWREISQEISEICNQLQKFNPNTRNILAIACNTTPYFEEKIQEICDSFGVDFISIADAIEQFIDLNKINEFTLLGIGYVLDAQYSGYRRILSRTDLSIKELSSESIDRIDKLAHDVKRGISITKCFNSLMDIIKHNTSSEGEHVIVALTEMSVILNQKKDVLLKWSKKGQNKNNIIDAVEVYADVLANIYIAGTNE